MLTLHTLSVFYYFSIFFCFILKFWPTMSLRLSCSSETQAPYLHNLFINIFNVGLSPLVLSPTYILSILQLSWVHAKPTYILFFWTHVIHNTWIHCTMFKGVEILRDRRNYHICIWWPSMLINVDSFVNSRVHFSNFSFFFLLWTQSYLAYILHNSTFYSHSFYF